MLHILEPANRLPTRCMLWSLAGNLVRRARTRPTAFWLLSSFILLNHGPLYAEWVEVESKYQMPGLQTVYLDREMIIRDGHLATVQQLTDYRWMQGGPRSTPRFLSTTTRKQFDCAEHRLRLLAFTEFPRRMAGGKPSAEYVDKDKWLPVRPDSIDQTLWELVCAAK